jgi:hypothetical protein
MTQLWNTFSSILRPMIVWYANALRACGITIKTWLELLEEAQCAWERQC